MYAADGVITAESEGVDNRKILVIAGVHGNEHNAVLAAYRVYQEFLNETDEKLKNAHTIRFILGVNKWGLLKNQREWASRTDVHPVPIPKDKPVDFNRVFTLDYATGTDKEEPFDLRLLIETAIADADVVIDVHNSPACDNIVLLNNDEYTASTVKFLNEIHMPNYMVWESQTSTIKKYAIDHGKTGFTVELGGMTVSRNDASVMIDQTAFLKTLVNMVDFLMPKFEKGPVLPPPACNARLCPCVWPYRRGEVLPPCQDEGRRGVRHHGHGQRQSGRCRVQGPVRGKSRGMPGHSFREARR